MIQPTRMEMNRLKAKQVTARRGHKLLKDKRDELIRQFLQQIKEAMILRRQVEEELERVQEAFLWAGTELSGADLKIALTSAGGGEIGRREENQAGVMVPQFAFLGQTRGLTCGLAFTPESLDRAAQGMEKLAPQLLELAEKEAGCRKMAAEIQKTRRRVGALEHVVLPETEQGIRYIRMKLEENERGSQSRLRKVKEKMLEQTYHWEKKPG